MDSYGLKATVTAVFNNDDYDIGFTYSDSDGTALDKQLTGKIDDMEQDLTRAIIDAYFDYTKSRKERELRVKQDAAEPKITGVADRFAELEEENRKLNAKIDELMNSKTSTPIENEKDVPKEEEVKPKIHPDNRHHHRNTLSMSDRELLNLMRILGF